MDISSAYDNVQKNILVKQLIEEKCSEKIVKYINKWLGGRVTIFIVEEISEKRIVRQGVPQGGVLNPLLYVAYTKELGKGLEEKVQMLQYADDIVLYNIGDGGKEQKEELEERIKIIGKRLRGLN